MSDNTRKRKRILPNPPSREISPSLASGDAAEDGATSDMIESDSDIHSEHSANGQNDVDENDDVDEEARDALRHVSFGALKEAQAELPSQKHTNRGRINARTATDGAKLQTIRARLAELAELKHKSGTTNSKSSKDTHVPESKKRKREHDTEKSDKSRSSKHAPLEETSTRPVTRRREAVSTQASHVRDPRFSAAVGHFDENKHRQRYAFLAEYRANELDQLNTALTASKKKRANVDLNDQERLKRAAGALHNQLRSEEEAERRRKVLSQHRKKERDLIQQGKQPFFLKRGEVRGLVDKDRSEALGKKGVERREKKRERKDEQKEKRRMPGMRRQR